ncbi:hypothetical protein ACFE04_031216 [Oxalis oulophora]
MFDQFFCAYAEPAAYGDDALQNEYSSYSRPKPRPQAAAYGGGDGYGGGESGYGRRPESEGYGSGGGYGKQQEEYGSGGGGGYGRRPKVEEYGSGYGRQQQQSETEEYGSGYNRRKPEPQYESGGGYGGRREESEYGSGGGGGYRGRREESEYGRKTTGYGEEEEGGGYGRRRGENDDEGGEEGYQVEEGSEEDEDKAIEGNTTSYVPNHQPPPPSPETPPPETPPPPPITKRMGTLFRRGNRAMSDLIVCRVTEDVNEHELRLFLRVLHRSGLTAKADMVVIFANLTQMERFKGVVEVENESFMKLVEYYKNGGGSGGGGGGNVSKEKFGLGFDLNVFMRSGKKEFGEPLWGRRRIKNFTNSNAVGNETGATRLSYGSVVGFEANELDPENSLSGFMDHVPMTLRQWACYPMLLGRVRRNFKHVMLVDVKNSVLLGDPLGRVKNQSPESVHVSIKSEVSSTSKHHRKNSDKTQSHSMVNTAILMGGSRGIRRLSNAVLYEIVRASMGHKKKNSITELGILGQLVGNEHLLKDINLIKSTESVAGTSSIAELAATLDPSLMKRGNSNINSNSNSSNLYSTIMRKICSFEVDGSVYRDC